LSFRYVGYHKKIRSGFRLGYLWATVIGFLIGLAIKQTRTGVPMPEDCPHNKRSQIALPLREIRSMRKPPKQPSYQQSSIQPDCLTLLLFAAAACAVAGTLQEHHAESRSAFTAAKELWAASIALASTEATALADESPGDALWDGSAEDGPLMDASVMLRQASALQGSALDADREHALFSLSEPGKRRHWGLFAQSLLRARGRHFARRSRHRAGRRLVQRTHLALCGRSRARSHSAHLPARSVLRRGAEWQIQLVSLAVRRRQH
jgi:hypothetical protein